MDESLKQALQQVGGQSALARALGIKPQAVQQWKRIPSGRVLLVEKAFGIPRQQLRPDLYPPEEKAA